MTYLSPLLYGKDGPRGEIYRRWRDGGFHSDTTVADIIRQGFADHPEGLVVFNSVKGDVEIAIEQMYAQSLRIAGALYAMGVRAGDAVAIQVPNCKEGVQAFHAAFLLGAVVVPIIHIYGTTEVGYILEKSKAKVLFIPDQWRNINYLERIPALRSHGALEHIVVVGDPGDAGAVSLDSLLEKDARDFPQPGGNPDDLALLIFTSGTTSAPKGVYHSHNSLKAQMRISMDIEHSSADAVELLSFPAGHIGGVLSTLKPYFCGSTTILMDVWSAASAARLIEKYGITYMSTTTYFISTLLDEVEGGNYNISSFKQCMTGAANVSPEIIEKSDTFGIATFRAFGCSEQPLLSCCDMYHPLQKRAYTDGCLRPGCDAKIIDDDGNPLPVGEDGEIACIGPSQMLGYMDPEHNATAFTPDGYFKTGDIGHFDEGGFLTITDRKKDIIIRGGENIASKEVEDVLLQHPDITEAAVVAMKDPKLGERVCAFILTREGRDVSIAELIEFFVSRGVAKQKTPEKVVVWGEFPRTATGKVKKVELRTWLDQNP